MFVCLIFGFLATLPVFATPVIMQSGSREAGFFPFQLTTIIWAIISMFCYFIVILTCDERPEFQSDEVFPLIKSIKESLKHKSFRMQVGLNFCKNFTNSIGLSFLFVYVLILGSDFGTVALYFYLIFLFVGYGSSLLCLKLRQPHGMRNLVLKFGLSGVIGAVIIFFLSLIPNLEFLLWIGYTWNTFFGGAITIFLSSFLFLVMDEDEVIHGSRREGMFFGMNALFTKPAESLGPIFATIFLGIISYNGFIPEFIPQMPGTLLGIKILFLIVPAIVNFIGLIFMYLFPQKSYYDEIQVKLNKLHQQKKERIKI